MKKYYICYPYNSAPKRNVAQVKKIALWLWRCGYLPIAPHLAAGFLSEKDRREVMRYCIKLLSTCDVLIVCGKNISEGMREEIMWAKKNKMKIEYYPAEVL